MDGFYVGTYFNFGYSFHPYDFTFGFMLTPYEFRMDLIVIDFEVKFKEDVPLGWI